MIELKSIICDVSNEYTLPPHQAKQLFDRIIQTVEINQGTNVLTRDSMKRKKNE